MEIICSTIEPENFNSKFEGAFCILETNKREILLLHRQDYKPEGNTWGIPGGKMNIGEAFERAVRRETMEETGIDLEGNKVELLKKVYVKFPEYDFIFYMFRCKIGERCSVTINSQEHKNYCWIRPEDASNNLPLIGGLDECFKMVY